jgi:ribosome-associated protein
MKRNDIRQQVLIALSAAQSKKAEEITILELGQQSSAFTDYFLICSGGNPRQVQAIADEIDEKLSAEGFEPNHREGYEQAEWILLDYVDFVVHVFSLKSRGFYDLERLWKSARHVTESDLKAPARARPAARGKTAPKTIAKAPKRARAARKRARK